MDENFLVLSRKTVKYLGDATIVAKLSHWNVRGADSYEVHLLFDRVHGDISELMDGLIETLRACGFNPDFDLFSGPGISMSDYGAQSLVELTLDYCLRCLSAVGAFYNFCEENSHDPRLVGISNHLQNMAETLLNDQYLLQARLGY
jgi:hypothetical protein